MVVFQAFPAVVYHRVAIIRVTKVCGVRKAKGAATLLHAHLIEGAASIRLAVRVRSAALSELSWIAGTSCSVALSKSKIVKAILVTTAQIQSASRGVDCGLVTGLKNLTGMADFRYFHFRCGA